jgi:hypothetical protein
VDQNNVLKNACRRQVARIPNTCCIKKISKGILTGMTDEEKGNFRRQHGIEPMGPPINYLKQ